jgi:hypothetical protein
MQNRHDDDDPKPVLTPSSLINQSLASADDIVVVIERLNPAPTNTIEWLKNNGG